MFGGGFKAAKCKTLLRLAMARIKLLRNKRDIQVKQMRKDIAQLLSTGQEPSARIRVEHIAREQNIMAAYDIIELFCELIIVRLPIIESQKICPMDLKEAVSSLIFASPRCADLPELLQVRGLFTSKYGKEFVATAAELRPECGVNRRIIEKLSVRAPSGETKLKLLTEIASEHNVNWDPANSEAELLKHREDLLDGPSKFFGASQMPIPEPQPSGPKLDELASNRHRAPTGPPDTPAAPPVPLVVGQPIHQLSSSDSEEDTSSGDKKQFIPFVAPVRTKGATAEKSESSSKVTVNRSNMKDNTSEKSDSSLPSSREDPYARARKEGNMNYDNILDYGTVAAAAKAAAQSADRAVAAARAAAELAKTHPSKRESLTRNASQDTESSEEDSEEEEKIETTKSSGNKNEPVRHGKSVSYSKPADLDYRQEKLDSSSRSDVDDSQESSVRKGNSGHKQESPFSRSSMQVDREDNFSRNYSEEGSERGSNPGGRFDSESTFWTRDQEVRQGANLMPDKMIDSGGFYPRHGNEGESLYRKDSDLFKNDASEELPSSRPKDKESYKSTSKIFSSSDSSSNLFKRSSSEEVQFRSSTEAPFYDSKQGFVTPKFDDEELTYSRNSSLPYRDELSFRRDLDSPRSKPSFNEFWRTSSLAHPSDVGEDIKSYKSFGRGERGSGNPDSGSHSIFDMHSDEAEGQTRGDNDVLSSRSSYKEDVHPAELEDQKEPSSPVPTKSRRTRNSTKSRESLESGGSGGLPPAGRSAKFSSSENIEPSAPRSLDYRNEPDSQTLAPKSSLTGSTLLDRAPPSTSSAYQSPDMAFTSSPSVMTGSISSRSSPVLERKDSPSAPPVHPKLPDYDDLAARFEALKGKAKR